MNVGGTEGVGKEIMLKGRPLNLYVFYTICQQNGPKTMIRGGETRRRVERWGYNNTGGGEIIRRPLNNEYVDNWI